MSDLVPKFYRTKIARPERRVTAWGVVKRAGGSPRPAGKNTDAAMGRKHTKEIISR